MLADHHVYDAATEALAFYGRDLIPLMQERVSDPGIQIEIVRRIPAVAGKIVSQDSVDFLFTLSHFEDIPVRNEALKALNGLKVAHAYLQVDHKLVVELLMEEAGLPKSRKFLCKKSRKRTGNILIRILQGRLEGNLERIFRLLGLRYPSDEILRTYDGIREKNPEFRSAAMEYLDSLLEINLKRVIMPVVETAYLEIEDRAALERKSRLPSDFECFEKLLKGKDIRVKLAVLYLIEQLGDRRFLPLVTAYFRDKNIKVASFARRAAEGIGQVEG